jgi:hypothetical protein
MGARDLSRNQLEHERSVLMNQLALENEKMDKYKVLILFLHFRLVLPNEAILMQRIL